MFLGGQAGGYPRIQKSTSLFSYFNGFAETDPRSRGLTVDSASREISRRSGASCHRDVRFTPASGHCELLTKDVHEARIRKSLFFRTVLHLILQVNEEIFPDRQRPGGILNWLCKTGGRTNASGHRPRGRCSLPVSGPWETLHRPEPRFAFRRGAQSAPGRRGTRSRRDG